MNEQERVLVAVALAAAHRVVQRDPALQAAARDESVDTALVVAITGIDGRVVEACLDNLGDDGMVEPA